MVFAPVKARGGGREQAQGESPRVLLVRTQSIVPFPETRCDQVNGDLERAKDAPNGPVSRPELEGACDALLGHG
jgi:hypothetical protein